MTKICPNAKSDMTPCFVKDGDMALSDDGHCVGCDLTMEQIEDEAPQQKVVPDAMIGQDSQGNGLFIRVNLLGHTEYWSSGPNGGTMIWNTSMISPEMLLLALAAELAPSSHRVMEAGALQPGQGTHGPGVDKTAPYSETVASVAGQQRRGDPGFVHPDDMTETERAQRRRRGDPGNNDDLDKYRARRRWLDDAEARRAQLRRDNPEGQTQIVELAGAPGESVTVSESDLQADAATVAKGLIDRGDF